MQTALVRQRCDSGGSLRGVHYEHEHPAASFSVGVGSKGSVPASAASYRGPSCDQANSSTRARQAAAVSGRSAKATPRKIAALNPSTLVAAAWRIGPGGNK